MDNTITVNMENLTKQEREQLISLIEKSNELSEPNPKKRWRAKREEGYYFIDMNLDVRYDVDTYLKVDNEQYKVGNYFKTKKEAEFEREKRLVYQELKDYAIEHNEGKINFYNQEQDKFYIYYRSNENRLVISYTNTWYDMLGVYFTSKEIARNAINTIGEQRIKKYLFGVE